jgi:hypothetical protein
MKLPDSAHTSRPWRIHELAADFRLEDVWALPTPGGPDDLARLVEQFAAGDEPGALDADGRFVGDADGLRSTASRTLFALRWKLGEWFGWDDGPRGPTLRDRLPADLLASPGPDPENVPFTSLYLTHDEWAAEIVNRTVHGVLHLGWVADDRGGHHAQMAVLVKPNGRFGWAYMAAITPFRHLIVYPVLIPSIGRRWRSAKLAPMDRQTA